MKKVSRRARRAEIRAEQAFWDFRLNVKAS